jgi:hypothetical protein
LRHTKPIGTASLGSLRLCTLSGRVRLLSWLGWHVGLTWHSRQRFLSESHGLRALTRIAFTALPQAERRSHPHRLTCARCLRADQLRLDLWVSLKSGHGSDRIACELHRALRWSEALRQHVCTLRRSGTNICAEPAVHTRAFVLDALEVEARACLRHGSTIGLATRRASDVRAHVGRSNRTRLSNVLPGGVFDQQSTSIAAVSEALRILGGAIQSGACLLEDVLRNSAHQSLHTTRTAARVGGFAV